MFSLRRFVWLVFMAALLLLGLVIFLGVNQYLVADRYNAVIEAGEKAIFRFATVRELVTEALIERDIKKLEQLVPELEDVHSALKRLQETPQTPAEFELGFIDKIDIAGIVITIKRIGAAGFPDSEIAAVQREMRTIADHLIKFDRVVVGQARSRMVNLQLVIIGSMGIAVTIVSFSLIILYRNSIVPMLFLTDQLRQENIEPEDIAVPAGSSREVAELAEIIRQRQADSCGRGPWNNTEELQYSVLAEIVNETTNRLNGIINYAQLLYDMGDRENPAQNKELLGKIMTAGSEIAGIWKKIQ